MNFQDLFKTVTIRKILVKEKDSKSNNHLDILPECGGVSALLLPVGPQLIDAPFVNLIDFFSILLK